MTKKKIKCIMHYDTHDNRQERAYHLAARTKADYVFQSFRALGYDIELLSASPTRGARFAKGMRKTVCEGFELRLLSSLGRGGPWKNRLAGLLFRINFVSHLLFFVKRHDIVWVYHSLALMAPLRFLKKIKRFRLILEVEELYGDVIASEKASAQEKAFVKLADAYIFPSKQLAELMAAEDKPSIISHGTYDVTEEDLAGFGDGKIHVVYAGTLDPRMGSHSVVEMAKLLDDRYHVHILGGGKPSEIEDLKNAVDCCQDGLACRLTYDGILKGEDYLTFMKKCHIGLCPHQLDAPFNLTAFPSKILSYMSNGLQVVSIRIPVIEESDIGAYMHYYDGNSTEDFARAVREITLEGSHDSRVVIRQLDKTFRKELSGILQTLE